MNEGMSDLVWVFAVSIVTLAIWLSHKLATCKEKRPTKSVDVLSFWGPWAPRVGPHLVEACFAKLDMLEILGADLPGRDGTLSYGDFPRRSF